MLQGVIAAGNTQKPRPCRGPVLSCAQICHIRLQHDDGCGTEVHLPFAM